MDESTKKKVAIGGLAAAGIAALLLLRRKPQQAVCNPGESKCIGPDLYVCDGGQWQRSEINSPSCAVNPGTATLYGVVTDLTGAPIQGIRVSAGGYSDTSEADGRYRVENLTPAGYTVRFEDPAGEYESESASVSLAAGLNELNVSLAPVPPISGPGTEWTDLGKVCSDTIYTLGFPLYDGVVIAGCWYGAAFRSTNYGAAWSSLGIFEDINGGVAYLGNNIIVMGDASGNIFRSTDSGANWTKVTTLTNRNIHPMISLGNGIVVAGTHTGDMYRSTDYGLNWSSCRAGDGIGVISMAYLGNGIAICCTENYLYRSTDNGASWSRKGSLYKVHAMTPMDEGMVIVIDFNGKAFGSEDYGNTWPLNLGTLPYNHIRAAAYLGDGIVIAGGDNKHLYRSEDYGRHWADLGVLSSNFIYAMAYLGNNIAIIGDRSGHIYRSTW